MHCEGHSATPTRMSSGPGRTAVLPHAEAVTMPLNDPELGCSERDTSMVESGLPVTVPPTPDNGQPSGGNGNVLTELEIALSTPGLTLDMHKYLIQKRFQHPTKMEPGKGNTARQVHC